MMQRHQQSHTRVFWMQILLIFAIVVLTQGALAEKEVKTYPEQGKIVGKGTSGHTVSSGGGMVTNGTGNVNMHSREVYTYVYKVETDTKAYELDCGKKPTFHSTGAECGGDKKFEVGDVIHFRVDKGWAYVSITKGNQSEEEKLRVLNEEIRSEPKPADKP